MAFSGGLWLCCVKVRTCEALQGCVGSAAQCRNACGAGVTEQDPSPACTAWASPGLLHDPAPCSLCLGTVYLLQLGLCSHTSTESDVCALAMH